MFSLLLFTLRRALKHKVSDWKSHVKACTVKPPSATHLSQIFYFCDAVINCLLLFSTGFCKLSWAEERRLNQYHFSAREDRGLEWVLDQSFSMFLTFLTFVTTQYLSIGQIDALGRKRGLYFKDSFNLPCILVRGRKVLKMSDHILLCILLMSYCRYVLETFSRSDSPLD